MNDVFNYIYDKDLIGLENYLKTEDINVVDDEGKSLLIHSVINDFNEAFDLLIKNYININLTDDDGNSALMYTIIYNRIGFFKRLIREGADFNIQNKKKESPIMLALDKKRDQMIRILLDLDVDLSVKNINDENIFFSIVKSHDIDLLIDTLNGRSQFLNSKNFTNRTLLHQAVIVSDFEMTKYLLQRGLMANAQDNFGETPIFFAIRNEDYDIIRILIEYGALIEGRNHFYETPLEVASVPIRDFILYQINSVKYSRYIKKYPLHVAVIINDYLKVKQNATVYNLTKKDEYNLTPSEYASKLGFVEIYNYLEQKNKNNR